MYPWQKEANSSQVGAAEKKTFGQSETTSKPRNHVSMVSSVLTRFTPKSEEIVSEFDSVDNIEIDFEPDDLTDSEDSDKGIMESLMEHIEANAKNTIIAINNEFDMLILALNERRKELLLKVAVEKEKKVNRLRNKRRKYARSFCRENENPASGSCCRSSDDSIVDTQRDARTVENLRPLQCGDLKLVCQPDFYEELKRYGEIEASLASGVHSEAMGLGLNYSFIGEEASFNVVTRDNTMNKTFSDEDNIKVLIKAPGEKVVTALINTKNNGLHAVKYTPSVTGLHKIHVFVNKFELLESPFTCETFSKETLAFEQGQALFSGSENTDVWVLNKEETSALLECNSQSGALIFGTQSYSNGKHGWKIKFTSACTGVNISIGVSQKTRIVDIDIKHTCMFRLDTANAGHMGLRRNRSQRKLSTFHRETRTFFVLLDMEQELLTIICFETEERQDISIPGDVKNLFPCVYMVHQCNKNVCPRPLVAFS